MPDTRGARMGVVIFKRFGVNEPCKQLLVKLSNIQIHCQLTLLITPTKGQSFDILLQAC